MPALVWIIIGVICLLLIIFFGVARARARPVPVRLVSREGQTMIEISSVSAANGELVVKGRLMGTMPATILIRPEEAWKALGLIGPLVILTIPGLMATGWWRCRQQTARKPSTVDT